MDQLTYEQVVIRDRVYEQVHNAKTHAEALDVALYYAQSAAFADAEASFSAWGSFGSEDDRVHRTELKAAWAREALIMRMNTPTEETSR